MLYTFWRILPGIFLEDFSGHFSRRKNPARKSAKKSGGSKIKIREKSVLPKAGPKKSGKTQKSTHIGKEKRLTRKSRSSAPCVRAGGCKTETTVPVHRVSFWKECLAPSAS